MAILDRPGLQSRSRVCPFADEGSDICRAGPDKAHLNGVEPITFPRKPLSRPSPIPLSASGLRNFPDNVTLLDPFSSITVLTCFRPSSLACHLQSVMALRYRILNFLGHFNRHPHRHSHLHPPWSHLLPKRPLIPPYLDDALITLISRRRPYQACTLLAHLSITQISMRRSCAGRRPRRHLYSNDKTTDHGSVTHYRRHPWPNLFLHGSSLTTLSHTGPMPNS